MRKFISVLVVTIMVFGMFTGCSDTTTASEVYDPTIKVGDTGGLKLPLTKENMKIQWQVASSESDLNDTWFIKKLEGITGVDIELLVMPTSVVKEKLNVLIASNQLPDIIGSNLAISQAHDISVQGGFAAVEDYTDKLPNFKKTFVDNKDNNWIFGAYSAPDGKLYGYYGYDYNRDINHTFMYRKDIFDKHGIKMWNNPEEFYQALKKLKQIYPESYPYTSKVTDQIFQKWAPGWGIEAHEVFFDEEKNVFVYGDTDPRFKEMLDFMKKLYSEGLLDPEYLTNTQSSWTQRITSGKSFVTFDWIDRMIMFKEQVGSSNPDFDLRFAKPVGPEQSYKETTQICWPRYVKKQDEKREEVAFKLLDFCLSPAGKELMTMGIEGETFEIGDDGMAKYIEFPDKTPSMQELVSKYGMFTEGMYLSFDRRSSYFNFVPQLKEAQEYVQDKSHVDPVDPELNFTSEEREKMNEYASSLTKSGKEFAVKYILGNVSWDEWVKKAESLGSEKLVKIYNDAYKRLN